MALDRGLGLFQRRLVLQGFDHEQDLALRVADRAGVDLEVATHALGQIAPVLCAHAALFRAAFIVHGVELFDFGVGALEHEIGKQGRCLR